MTIQEFFERSVGRWRSQRSGHHLISLPTGSAVGETQAELTPSDQRKATLDLQKLAVDDPAVVSLCQAAQPQINPAVIYPLHISWEEEGGLSSRHKPQGSTVLVLVPNADDGNFGAVLQSTGQGRYELGTDERLTIWTEYGSGKLEERFWFASENLRFRLLVQHSNIESAAKLPLAVFYSEIRVLNPK